MKCIRMDVEFIIMEFQAMPQQIMPLCIILLQEMKAISAGNYTKQHRVECKQEYLLIQMEMPLLVRLLSNWDILRHLIRVHKV